MKFSNIHNRVGKFARAIAVMSAALQAPSAAHAEITNGVNIQPSYYNFGWVVIDWKQMKQQSYIGTVRIEIEPGALEPSKIWIREACQQGFKVIATYHRKDSLVTDKDAILKEAGRWWAENYKSLKDAADSNHPNKQCEMYINLMNEWGTHNISPESYAQSYNSAIASVRSAKYFGPIIIDIPGSGQETRTAKLASDKIIDGNIVFSVHVYANTWNSATGQCLTPNDLAELAQARRPIIIGEFGSGKGDCKWEKVIEHARNKRYPVLAWAWNGDGGDMNMVSPAWKDNDRATSYSINYNGYFGWIYPMLAPK